MSILQRYGRAMGTSQEHHPTTLPLGEQYPESRDGIYEADLQFPTNVTYLHN